MASVKGKDSKEEILIRKVIFKHGYRFRKNVTSIFGKPDIVLHKYRVVIFVHGCFWHGHSCKKAQIPNSNTTFWADKIDKNIIRDRIVLSKLKSMGWNVIIIWSCQLKNVPSVEKTVNKLLRKLSLFSKISI